MNYQEYTAYPKEATTTQHDPWGFVGPQITYIVANLRKKISLGIQEVST